MLQPSITKSQNKMIITSLNFFTSILFATNTNEKTLKHDYFNHINIAYRFTIFQLDTRPFGFLFFFVVLSFYPHTIHKTSKLWFLPNSPPLLPPTCLPCLALTHKKQSFRASPKIIVQQLVVMCIKLIITKQNNDACYFLKEKTIFL